MDKQTKGVGDCCPPPRPHIYSPTQIEDSTYLLALLDRPCVFLGQLLRRSRELVGLNVAHVLLLIVNTNCPPIVCVTRRHSYAQYQGSATKSMVIYEMGWVYCWRRKSMDMGWGCGDFFCWSAPTISRLRVNRTSAHAAFASLENVSVSRSQCASTHAARSYNMI